MADNHELPVIAVLSVESDKVSFTTFSLIDGKEIATSIIWLPLIVGQPKETTPSTTEQCQDTSLEDFDSLPPADQRQEELLEDFDPLSPNPLIPGQVEQEPDRIWEAVEDVVNDTVRKMYQGGEPATYIKSVAIINEMETLLAWDAVTGKPLYNAIHWTDIRMKYGNVERDGDLDVSAGVGAGTAAAVHWLIKRSPAVMCAQDNVRFGTLDTWLLWKLTDGQIYSTDVTNASCTRLLDMSTLEWDQNACQSCGLLAHSWPSIRPLSTPATVVLMGGLLGLPVHVVMTRPSATLYGQRCFRRGQAIVTLASCSVVAIGSYDDRGCGPPQTAPCPGGPLPMVGYVEPNPMGMFRTNIVYGLLTKSEATSVFSWLKNNMSLVSSVTECMDVYSSARPAGTQAFMVPAMQGMPFAPYGQTDAGMIVCGINEQMGREHMIVAAVDGVCYTAVDMVYSIAKSSGIKFMDTVFVDGMYSYYGDMMQQLADVSGIPVVTNQEDMAIQGAAMMSASMLSTTINTYHRNHHQQQAINYMPTFTIEQRMESKSMWKKAVQRSYGWTKVPGQMLNDKFVSKQGAKFSRYLAQWHRWMTNVFHSMMQCSETSSNTRAT